MVLVVLPRLICMLGRIQRVLANAAELHGKVEFKGCLQFASILRVMVEMSISWGITGSIAFSVTRGDAVIRDFSF